ncbi:hypothetical protein NGRA_2290 [Nosema granulosis]|uniref:Uncharacterized protein n=1 Tax=Nosema granulosis TaxID=83296 RepID=A0A9P6KYC9_9MICR|nr:hypothetical protein NGRA_2290 [Nosema granulosis]
MISDKIFYMDIAKLAAVDGITFNSIANSKFIRRSLSFEYPNVKTVFANVVSRIFEKCYEDEKDQIICELKRLIEQGTRFSVSLDKYTSNQNVRYINIDLHYLLKTRFLCNRRIYGVFDSTASLAIVSDVLMEFRIDMHKHVVSTITDEASVMVKFGREARVEHQKCLAHAIHLAVTKTLYKKTIPKEQEQNEIHQND